MDTSENADIADDGDSSGSDAAQQGAATVDVSTPQPPEPSPAAPAATDTDLVDQVLGSRPPTEPVRTAAFFDLDKTIIAKSSALAFSRPFYQGGLINRRAVLQECLCPVRLPGRRRGPRPDGEDAAVPLHPARGWNVQQVREIVAETLHGLIDPLIYEEAASLIEQHHAAGRDVVIVSAVPGQRWSSPSGRCSARTG